MLNKKKERTLLFVKEVTECVSGGGGTEIRGGYNICYFVAGNRRLWPKIYYYYV